MIETKRRGRRKVQDVAGVGIYTVPQAARLIGAPYGKLKRWIGDDANVKSVIHRDAPIEGTLSFMELMELMFIHLFRKEGVSLQTIRKAAVAASRKFGEKHPFAVKRFDTDGKDIFATLCVDETDENLVQDLARGQLVFEQIIKPFFRKIEYRGPSEALRYWPLDSSGRVVLDPQRRFGQPIDSETGVPIDAIISALNAGDGQEPNEVARWLDIPLEAVTAAISFERSLAS